MYESYNHPQDLRPFAGKINLAEWWKPFVTKCIGPSSSFITCPIIKGIKGTEPQDF